LKGFTAPIDWNNDITDPIAMSTKLIQVQHMDLCKQETITAELQDNDMWKKFKVGKPVYNVVV
jgi:hypothetical protein